MENCILIAYSRLPTAVNMDKDNGIKKKNPHMYKITMLER